MLGLFYVLHKCNVPKSCARRPLQATDRITSSVKYPPWVSKSMIFQFSEEPIKMVKMILSALLVLHLA